MRPSGVEPHAGSVTPIRPERTGASRGAVARLAALPGVSTASAVAEAAEHAKAAGQVLPVASPLAGLLPREGLRRGSTVAVRGSTSLLLALLAEATARGSWAAVVGVPGLGLVAAEELGVELSRLALVPHPGAEFPAVTAALLDGLDLVAARPPAGPGSETLARRLSARARQRGSVLLSLGAWPGAEVELRCRTIRWTGTEDGHAHLREREVVVEATGRAALARPVQATLLLPGSNGGVGAPDVVLPATRSSVSPSPVREVAG
ncbi:hypothetical protein [Saccharomonospora sp. NB11]|uniref:hypothetical protein n=1 Tax=Saccharomonospora sp. NB11 TaxID=1642298 RepID=UPI001E5D1A7E|nr:hypothetical protein [Saccharomonospora sp. NB11]